MSLRFHFGPCVLDTATRELRRHGQPVALQARVFECLLHLIEHRDRAVTRDELVQAVFRRSDVSDAQLGQVIVRTRRAVGDDGQSQHTVLTVPRYGFRWVAEVRVETGASAGQGGELRPDAHAGDDAGTDAAARPLVQAPTRDPQPETQPPEQVPQPLAQPAPDRPVAPARPRPVAAASLLLALVALLAVLWWRAAPPGEDTHPATAVATAEATAESPGALLVLPTRVADGEELAWVRLGLMDYIGDRLRQGGLAVLSSESALAAHARGAADDPEHLRALLGRGWRVESEVARAGEGWSVRLAARDADGVTQAASAEAPELLDAARAAADRLAPRLGGLHRFEDWHGHMLSDSGGYQVFSLDPGGNVRLDDDGVTFRSHLNGSIHRFTPEVSIGIQHKLGADIIFAFDELTTLMNSFQRSRISSGTS